MAVPDRKPLGFAKESGPDPDVQLKPSVRHNLPAAQPPVFRSEGALGRLSGPLDVTTHPSPSFGDAGGITMKHGGRGDL